ELREGQARIRDRTADLAREIDAVLGLLTELRGARDADAAPTGSPAVAYPGAGQPPAASSGFDGRSEAALLRATQLAVAGSGRGEIEARLLSEFDLADPGAVIDEILGASEASSG
ncbi:MAG: hypothetical protein M3P84_11290, partial [Chloroflexota bacterium]|nr:hypothetical protein [Chloroflexota bacterium]